MADLESGDGTPTRDKHYRFLFPRCLLGFQFLGKLLLVFRTSSLEFNCLFGTISSAVRFVEETEKQQNGGGSTAFFH